MGNDKGKEALGSFTRVAELCVLDDGYNGMFLIKTISKILEDCFFENDLQGKYLKNVKRRFNLTDNLVDRKDKKETLKSVIKKIKEKEKLAKKSSKAKTEDKVL